jgi:PAS domain S-box-containing protein
MDAEELRGSHKQLKLITDEVPALIAYVDADRRYQFNNKAYEDWFGRSRSDVIGKHVKEVLGADAYKVSRRHIDKALSGHKAEYETRIPYKDGGKRHVHAVYVPDIGEGGNVKGFFALVTEIAEHRKDEK